MPVLTWKRLVALALLGFGVTGVAVGALSGNILLLTVGALAITGAIGFVVLGTYRRTGFAIHSAAQRHDQVVAILESVQRINVRLERLEEATRRSFGPDLRSLVLSAFRDVDERMETLGRMTKQNGAEVDARLASVDSILRVVGDRFESQGSSVQQLPKKVEQLQVDLGELKSAVAGLDSRFHASILGLRKDLDSSLANSISGLQGNIGQSVVKPIRALADVIGDGRLRYDVLNDAASMRHLRHRLPLDGALPPLMSGWALEPSSLAALVDVVLERQPRLVVECGSGVSTIWLGRAVNRYGGRVVALEHLGEYAEAAREDLIKHGLSEVAEVRLAPLESYQLPGGEYLWYGREEWSGLQNIDMLVVDGPPKATGERARYPALPLLADALAPGALIVVDDVHREDERAIVAAWQETGRLRLERQLGPRTILMTWQPVQPDD